jgi:hypothetical protein
MRAQCRDEARGADLVGCADRDEVGPVTFGGFRRHDVCAYLLEGALAGEDDPRAEQAVEEQIARRDRWGVAAQDDHAPHPARCRRRRGLPSMVRLHRTERDERVGAPAQRFGDAELELARLVAAGREPGLVVALHEQARAAERPGQARQLVERCGQVTQANAREPVCEHAAS